ncbi:hypothetical protein [Streptomyces sp. NPDC057580]|uniref:hypothetical protein n=1 Tax=Streptomyces sp. NPDC057580 TaxID=3346173 RepID=UPI00367879AD
MPSWFATGLVIMYGPEESTVVAHPMHLPGTPTGPPRVLGPLLGRTCAAVLSSVRLRAGWAPAVMRGPRAHARFY